VKSRAWLGGVGLLLVAFSCDPGLSLGDALQGKRCGEELACLPGFKCSEGGVCVPRDTGSSAAASSGMTPPPADAGGAGGSEALGDGMDTMSSDVADAAPSCTPIPLFLDRDGDGFGSDAVEDQTTDCPKKGWASVGGDCLDADLTADKHAFEVHPGQLGFFSEGYPRPGQPGEISFDYDCSRGEEADPNNSAVAPGDADDCSAAGAMVLCGSLGGMLPLARSGADLNAVCGSKTFLLCNDMGSNGCVPELVDRTTKPFLCH